VLSRFGQCLALAVAALAFTIVPASASITVGQTGDMTTDPCGGTFDLLQPTVTSGTSYVIPRDGTIVSWSTGGSSGSAGLVIAHPLSETDTYEVVTREGPHPLSTALDTFPANIPVRGGDLVGLSMVDVPKCAFNAPGDNYFSHSGQLADGTPGVFSSSPDYRVNVSAAFNPSNAFSVNGLRRHRKRGTANFKIHVPGPGILAIRGKGVATKNLTVNEGDVLLLVKASKKFKGALLASGHLKLKPKISFTPTDGVASTQSEKVKLLKNV
jgi:hypothetical protein